MTTVYVKNKSTGEVKQMPAVEAVDLVGSRWRLLDGKPKKVKTSKVKKKEKVSSAIEFAKDSFRSPDYIEETERKLRKLIPLLRIGKFKIFLNRPFIR